MIEEWRDIPKFNGKYQASTLGRIKNNKDYILKFKENKKYRKTQNDYIIYYSVTLRYDNKDKPYRVNILVAETFIPNPDNKPTVNHKNHITTDNRVENLEWATYKEQQDNEAVSKRFVPVMMFDKQMNLIKCFTSILDAKKFLNKENSHGFITDCCKGKKKTAYGYIWKYQI